MKRRYLSPYVEIVELVCEQALMNNTVSAIDEIGFDDNIDPNDWEGG